MKKFHRILLHFGGDKTGSTSIQTTLDRARDFLISRCALAYPPGSWHAQLGSFFSSEPEKYIYNVLTGVSDRGRISKSDAAYISAMNEWISRLPDAVEQLVFSYEGFVDLDVAALRRFKDYCMRYTDRVEVVLYVRPPLSYAVSAMSQRVKMGFPSFDVDSPPVFTYMECIQRILTVFSRENVQIRLFDRSTLVNGDVVEDFLSLLGFDDSLRHEILKFQVKKKENVSLSWPALKIGDALLTDLKRKGWKWNPSFMSSVGVYLENIPGPKIKLTLEQAHQILERTRRDADYLRNEFNIEFSENLENYTVANGSVVDIPDELLLSVVDAWAGTLTHSAMRRADFSDAIFTLIKIDVSSHGTLDQHSVISFTLDFYLADSVDELECGIHIHDQWGKLAFGTNSTLCKVKIGPLKPGVHQVIHSIVSALPEGDYVAGFAFSAKKGNETRDLAWFHELASFAVRVNRYPECVGYASIPAVISHRQVEEKAIVKPSDGTGCGNFIGVPATIKAGQKWIQEIEVYNMTSQDWYSLHFHPLNISYHWLDEAGQAVVFDGLRTPMPGGVLRAGEQKSVHMEIIAPLNPGRYRLLAMPVSEINFWFDEKGFAPAEMFVEILPQ